MLLVPLLTLATLLSVGPENAITVPSSASHTAPSIARNDSGSALVVWTEQGAQDSPATILAMRVDGKGRPRDPAPIVVGLGNNWRPRPFVASDGTGYLVAFQSNQGRLMVARIADDGRMPEPAHETGFTWAPDMCIAWTGTEYLVGHTVLRDASRFFTAIQVVATRISRDGVGINALILGEYQTGGMILFPSAGITCARGQSSSLFAWNGTPGANGAIVGHEGTIIAPLDIPVGASPAAAANGGSFLVASAGDSELARVLVSESGNASVPVDAPIATEMDPFTIPSVAVAARGSGYVVAFGTSDVHAVPLDGGGRMTGSVVEVSATDGLDRAPAIAGGDVPIVVYQRERDGADWTVFTRVLFEQTRRRAVRR